MSRFVDAGSSITIRRCLLWPDCGQIAVGNCTRGESVQVECIVMLVK
jgi:hypothetical protein